MKSFTLFAVGDLALDPELTRNGEEVSARFCLLGTDLGEPDADGQTPILQTSLWFKAHGNLAEVLVRQARKGDQLIVLAYVHPDKWLDHKGAVQHDYSIRVESVRFGAPGIATMEELGLGKTAD